MNKYIPLLLILGMLVANNQILSNNENSQVVQSLENSNMNAVEPIEISDVAGLNAIHDNLEGNYILTTDIDLQDAEWTPAGSNTNSFKGTFDGNGYVISNYKITTSNRFSGLFGYVNSVSVIRNVGLEDFIINVKTPNTSGSPFLHAGGLAGNNYGHITNSYAIGTITADGSEATTPGTLPNNIYIGGLVGSNQPGGRITNSFADVEITTTGQAVDKATVTAGGLVANNRSVGSGSINQGIGNSFAKGRITATATSGVSLGGLVGVNTRENEITSTATNSYRYENQIFTLNSGAVTPNSTGPVNDIGLVATDDHLKDPTFYTSTLEWSSNVWDFSNLTNDGYPQLKNDFAGRFESSEAWEVGGTPTYLNSVNLILRRNLKLYEGNNLITVTDNKITFNEEKVYDVRVENDGKPTNYKFAVIKSVPNLKTNIESKITSQLGKTKKGLSSYDAKKIKIDLESYKLFSDQLTVNVHAKYDFSANGETKKDQTYTSGTTLTEKGKYDFTIYDDFGSELKYTIYISSSSFLLYGIIGLAVVVVLAVVGVIFASKKRARR